MQIFQEDDNISDIYQRSISLSISKEFAEKRQGKITIEEKQNSEQHDRRRELLAVEVQANKNKIIEEHGHQHFKNQVLRQFNENVSAKITQEFENTEYLYNHTLNIESAAPSILEILSLKAASINRINPLAKSLPWLSRDLLALVNKPQYRRDAEIQVTKVNLALSYIGLDNLKVLMPTYILKHWLPDNTAPHPLMKRKLWNDSLSVALAAKKLADDEGLDDFTAFTCGMLSNIGNLAVSRCVLKNYNTLHKSLQKTAFEEKDTRLYEVYAQLDASPEILLENLTKHSSKIAADMVELMRLDRLAITEPIFDIAYGNKIELMHPIAQIVIKAKAYVMFRTLAKENLITTDEAKLLLSSVKLTTKNIALLKKSDIDHIKLNFY
jgi:hypothetical protein